MLNFVYIIMFIDFWAEFIKSEIPHIWSAFPAYSRALRHSSGIVNRSIFNWGSNVVAKQTWDWHRATAKRLQCLWICWCPALVFGM